MAGKVKAVGAPTVSCARCGKVIPQNEFGMSVDCVWWQDRYLCWDCVKGKSVNKEANKGK